MKTSEYTLPEFWACAIVYGDYSGLSKDDISQLNTFLDMNGLSASDCIHVSEEREFRRVHDAIGYVLPCDCLVYTFKN